MINIRSHFPYINPNENRSLHTGLKSVLELHVTVNSFGTVVNSRGAMECRLAYMESEVECMTTNRFQVDYLIAIIELTKSAEAWPSRLKQVPVKK